MENINFIDLMFAVIIGVSVLLGLIRGLFRAVFGVLSLVLAFFAAKNFAPYFFNTMFDFIGDSLASVAMAYILVFITALLLFNVVSFIFRKMLGNIDLGGADNIGGFLFGAVRGVFFALVITIVLAITPLQSAAVWEESRFLPFIGGAMEVTLSLPVVEEYKKYWIFEEGRPRIDTAEIVGLKIIANPTGKIKSRDDELDDLPREGVEQSLHGNEEAKDIALQHDEQNRQQAPMQRIVAWLSNLLSGEVCVDCLTDGKEKYNPLNEREQVLKKLCEEEDESACVE